MKTYTFECDMCDDRTKPCKLEVTLEWDTKEDEDFMRFCPGNGNECDWKLKKPEATDEIQNTTNKL